MKKVVIVHGWGGNPQKNWMPSIKKDLEKIGYEVNVPAMPDTDYPNIKKWLLKLTKEIGIPDEDLYLIGHSLGCITIMRYLDTLSKDQKVGGVMFVAGFTDDLNIPEIKNFFETAINYANIKQKTNKFVAIHSDNDQYVALKYGDILKEKLGAEVIVKHNMEHFSDPKDNEAVSVLLQEILTSMIGVGG